MLVELIIVALVVFIIYKLWKLLVQLIMAAMVLGLVLYFKFDLISINHLGEQVNKGIQIVIEYGSAIVEKLI